jgi:Ca-activated chloride channel family protein
MLFSMHGQNIEVDQTKIDFGTIERGSERIVDVHFSNPGAKESLVLTSNLSRVFNTRWTGKRVLPDSTITLRIKFNPIQKGLFKEDVEVYFSSMQKPIVLKIRAEVNFIDRNDSPACPDFRQRPDDCCGDEPTLIHVINAQTGKPIKEARVRIVENGKVQRDVKTDKNGDYSEQIPVGFYFVMGEAEYFTSADTTGYINRRNNYIELALMPLDVEEKVAAIEPVQEREEELAQVQEEPEQEEDDRDEITIIQRIEPVVIAEEPMSPQDPEEGMVVTSEVLPEDVYARNSIVFLVDVSQSMANKGKMDLLQASMLGLVEVLRPTDQLAFMTYASNAVVVMDMTKGDRKAELEKAISALEAGGMTAGLVGFKRAYKMARTHFIDGGNNQLIVATDGAFRNADRPKLVKMAERNGKRGVKTTVIGIRSTDFAGRTLEELANIGKGSFIYVANFDASKKLLIEEVRKQSYMGD